MRLSEQSYSPRHLNRARHMDPQASSTRDSTQRDGKVGRSDDLRGVPGTAKGGFVEMRYLTPFMLARPSVMFKTGFAETS